MRDEGKTDVTPRPRGICPMCYRWRVVNKDGTMRWHPGARPSRPGFARPPCSGSGKAPAEVAK